MTSAALLQESVGSSYYENCSKKMRQLILDSCAEPKGKRNALLAEHRDLYTGHRPGQHGASPSLLGRLFSASLPLPLFQKIYVEVRKKFPVVASGLSVALIKFPLNYGTEYNYHNSGRYPLSLETETSSIY
jgi:hypothetical protein